MFQLNENVDTPLYIFKCYNTPLPISGYGPDSHYIRPTFISKIAFLTLNLGDRPIIINVIRHNYFTIILIINCIHDLVTN